MHTSHLKLYSSAIQPQNHSPVREQPGAASIKTVNHETHNHNGVEGSRPRGPVQLPFGFAGVVPSFSNIRFAGPRNACGSEAQLRAARSQARALATAAAPRPVVFFSPPSIPARHTSHLSRPSCSNKHHLPAGVHILRHVWFDIPLTLSYLRASCTVPRFCGLISSHLVHPICDSPASGGCRVAPRSA